MFMKTIDSRLLFKILTQSLDLIFVEKCYIKQQIMVKNFGLMIQQNDQLSMKNTNNIKSLQAYCSICFSVAIFVISNFKIQKEEIDWIGLLPEEALEKFEKEEDEQYEQSIRPWKELFRESLVAELSRRQRNNEPIDITPVATKPYDMLPFLTSIRFLSFIFRQPKTLKEKVINKLWGS